MGNSGAARSDFPAQMGLQDQGLTTALRLPCVSSLVESDGDCIKQVWSTNDRGAFGLPLV